LPALIAAKLQTEIAQMTEPATRKERYWNRDTVVRKITRVFPYSDVFEILAVLDAEPLAGAHRVHLAILKVCDEGRGLPDLSLYVEAAQSDYRDVLAWAESPIEMSRLSWDPAERKLAQARDAEQYLCWLERDERG
jgi:hypothetical protein